DISGEGPYAIASEIADCDDHWRGGRCVTGSGQATEHIESGQGRQNCERFVNDPKHVFSPPMRLLLKSYGQFLLFLGAPAALLKVYLSDASVRKWHRLTGLKEQHVVGVYDRQGCRPCIIRLFDH